MKHTRMKILSALACASFIFGGAQASTIGTSTSNTTSITLPPNVRVQRNVAYGSDPMQRMDVYMPAQAQNAPVILMVHGGGWQTGDKAMSNVVQNKLNHWVPLGFVLISVDYPLVPQADPVQQARSVALALAFAQKHAVEWGGNPHEFILMGHSSGANLVSQISAKPSMATSLGAQPWLGTVALDSAAYDVVTIMSVRHLPLYDVAFGANRTLWNAASPTLQLHSKTAPFLAVCSTVRLESCPQAQIFVDKARAYGAEARVLPEDLTHEQINQTLGGTSMYTDQVDAFMAGLDPSVAMRVR